MRILALVVIIFAVPAYAEPVYKITNAQNQSREIDANFYDVDLNKQNVGFEVCTTTPTLTDLRKGQIKLHKDTGVYHLYIRIGDDLIRFDGVKVN